MASAVCGLLLENKLFLEDIMNLIRSREETAYPKIKKYVTLRGLSRSMVLVAIASI